MFLALGVLLCLGCISPAAGDGHGQTAKAALIIVDVQDCFLSGGSLEVTGANEVVGVINGIRKDFGKRLSTVVVSQDWHCAKHVSFASSHPGRNAFDIVQLSYKDDGTLCYSDTVSSTNFPRATDCQGESTKTFNQTLWPDHCVEDVSQGPTSSGLNGNLHVEKDDVIIKKGDTCEIDSYSLFYDNGGLKSTGLGQILRDDGITELFVTGVALDYCVYFTALDGRKQGFDVYLVLDATRGVAQDSSDKAKADMAAQGIKIIYSYNIGDVLDSTGTNTGVTSKPLMFVYAVMLLQLLI